MRQMDPIPRPARPRRAALAALALLVTTSVLATAGPAAPPAGKAKAEAGATAKVTVVGGDKVRLPEYRPPESYSEDMVITAQGQTFVMKRAYDKTKIRSEMTAGDKQVVMIELGDEKGTSLILMPDDKRAMKQTRQAQQEAPGEVEKKHPTPEQPAPTPAQFTVEDQGEETLDGVAARKLKMTSADGVVLAWFEKATGAPLRMEGTVSGEQALVEWKNRKVEPQPASRFEVPKGYEVTDIDEMRAQMKGMGGMFKGMMGGAAQGMGQSMGGSFGSALGGSLAGPLGAVAGQYIGGKVGGLVGKKAAGAAD